MRTAAQSVSPHRPRTRRSPCSCAPVPREVPSVHGDVDPGRQDLHERQRAAQIEQTVRAAEGVGHHGAGQHDRLAREAGVGQRPRGLDHRVGAVRDDDAGLRRVAAATRRSSARPRSSRSRLSIIITVSIATSTRHRPRRSISWTCVSLKKSRPVSSSYSLSNVPPVTSIRIAIPSAYISSNVGGLSKSNRRRRDKGRNRSTDIAML